MKKISFLIALSITISFQSNVLFGQKRPVKKPTAPVSKPNEATPTEVETAPVKKTVVEVSPAQGFYNQGLKCEAKDYDCQVSNFTKAINLSLNTRDVFKRRAAAYAGREDYEKAIGDLTKAIELDLNDATGFKDRGKAYLEMPLSRENLQKAIQDLTSAIDLEPKDVEAYNLRGAAYLLIGMKEKSQADFDKSISINPTNVDSYLARGDAYTRLGQFEVAITSYTQALAQKPADVNVLGKRSEAYMILKRFDLALTDITKTLSIDPKQADAYFYRAQIYTAEKKYDEALRDYSKAIEINPKQAAYFFERASLYKTLKKQSELLADLTKTIEINPRNAQAYEMRCLVNYEVNDYPKAIFDCSVAINLRPASDDAYIFRGRAFYLETKNLEQYHSDFAKGSQNKLNTATREIQRGVKTAEVYERRAEGYGGLANYQQALQDIATAISLDPNRDNLYSLQAGYYNGMQNHFAAQDSLTKAIQLNPSSILFYYQRGMSYNIAKDTNRAVADFKKFFELIDTQKTYRNDLEIDISTAAVLLSFNYVQQKDNASALNILTKAIELLPTSGQSYYHRAYFYRFTLKDTQKAAADYTKGAEVGTDGGNWLESNAKEAVELGGIINPGRIAEAKEFAAKRKQAANDLLQSALAYVQGLPISTDQKDK